MRPSAKGERALRASTEGLRDLHRVIDRLPDQAEKFFSALEAALLGSSTSSRRHRSFPRSPRKSLLCWEMERRRPWSPHLALD
jgi:hypothetical protein